MNTHPHHPLPTQDVQDTANVPMSWITKQEQNKDTPFNLYVWGTSWVFHWHLTPRHEAHFSLKLQDFHFAQFQMV